MTRHAGRRDREARLDEVVLLLALSNRDQTGEAAHGDVRRRLEGGPARETGQEGHQGRDDHAETRVEQQRQEHAGRGGGHDVGQPGAAGRDLHRQDGDDEDQHDQEERAVAMPVLGPEPPQPAEQDRRGQSREEQPARRGAPCDRGLLEAEVADLDHVGRGDDVALIHDHLTGLESVHLDGLAGGGRRTCLLGERGAVGRVGDEERSGDRGRKGLLARIQIEHGWHVSKSERASLGRDLRVPNLAQLARSQGSHRGVLHRRPA